MMDFDPESNITDIGNLSSKASTQVLSGVENSVAEAGDSLSSGIADVSSTLSGLAGTAGEVSESLAATALGSLDIPVAGEVIALFAGIGSAIAGAIGGETPKPTVVQTGGDFSNTDEHSGQALSAY
jgi:phage-related tail protein